MDSIRFSRFKRENGYFTRFSSSGNGTKYLSSPKREQERILCSCMPLANGAKYPS